jgi:hypothetical protein
MKKKHKEAAFTVRFIRFSLGLAEASRWREQFSGQIADVVTKWLGPSKSRWFYTRKALENKSEVE